MCTLQMVIEFVKQLRLVFAPGPCESHSLKHRANIIKDMRSGNANDSFSGLFT